MPKKQTTSEEKYMQIYGKYWLSSDNNNYILNYKTTVKGEETYEILGYYGSPETLIIGLLKQDGLKKLNSQNFANFKELMEDYISNINKFNELLSGLNVKKLKK